MLNEQEIIANELLGLNNWNEISRRKDLLNEDLRKYKDKIIWSVALRYLKNISNDLLDELIAENKIADEPYTWSLISKNHAMNKDFIKKYSNKLNIYTIVERYDFKVSEIAELIEKPRVGDGATHIVGSDNYPFTIIEVNKNGTRIKVQADNANPVEDFDYYNNQNYEYTRNPNGSIYEVRLVKGYRWKMTGSKSYFRLGHRRKYQNPSF